jgi:hypothetical protein
LKFIGYSFLRNYDYLNLTKSVTDAQAELYKAPHETWAQMGSKFYSICSSNAQSIAATGADTALFLFVSTMRSCGYFIQPLPTPDLPNAHDNVDYLDNAIARGLSLWNPEKREAFKEGLAEGLSDEWNIYQAVGEWAVAHYYENKEGLGFYKPSFLSASEPLANEASFVSVGRAFKALSGGNQKAILKAVYLQEEPNSLGSAARDVYRDLRGLASLLHQGNMGFLKTFSEYSEKHDETAAAPSVALPSAPPAELAPSYQPIRNVNFLKRFLTSSVPSTMKEAVRSAIIQDRSHPVIPARGALCFSDLRSSPCYSLARLLVLHLVKDGSAKTPDCFPWNHRLENGKTVHAV